MLKKLLGGLGFIFLVLAGGLAYLCYDAFMTKIIAVHVPDLLSFDTSLETSPIMFYGVLVGAVIVTLLLVNICILCLKFALKQEKDLADMEKINQKLTEQVSKQKAKEDAKKNKKK